MATRGAAIVEAGGGLQAQGRQVLSAFYAALRALKLYPLENEAVQKALDELQATVGRTAEREGTLELRVLGDFFFLNETRLRLDLSNYATFGSFARALETHGIGAIQIESGVERGEWAPFLSLLLGDPGEPERFEAFRGRMARSPISSIAVLPESEAPVDVGEEEEREAAKRTYAQSVRVAKDVLTDVRLGKAVNVRKVKRAVQSIVDQVLTNETSIIGMTTLRDFDEYTFTHSVNVCIFSVVLGQKLGLNKLQLYELGLGALFHDIGKMRLDPEVINKASGLTDEEWQQLKEHPTEGLLSLFSLHGFADIPYRPMLVAYEHHMKLDLSGYPRNRRARNPALFSKIVAIADGFDAGTSVRSYQYQPWPPDAVLKEMRDNPARGFDQVLVKAFMNVTGVYPVGTLVILDSYELAVVVSPNPDAEHIHQPIVKIISDSMGLPVADPPTVDLSEIDPATGAPRRTIIKTTDPQKYGINVADYFV
ncbi:MAG: HD domain-containing protein [Gemmatimonadetes bacterium]|nr:HD domain-containing protein [Gemmatimonadota bacterium]